MEERSEHLRVSPGKEAEFRYFQRYYADSAAIDRLIEATEPENSGADCLAIDQFRGPIGVTDKALSGAFDSVVDEEVLETMWTHEYVAEKIWEFDSEELDRALRIYQYARDMRAPGTFTRFVAATGRSMRRVGQRLESRGTLEDPDNCTSC
jgi:hypothetical protein